MQTGRNAGLTGLVDLQVEGFSDIGAVAFHANVLIHSSSLSHRKISRRGRGLSGAPKYRLGDLSGGFTFEGEINVKKRPFPVGTKWNSGNITQQIDSNGQIPGTVTCSITTPVSINSISLKAIKGGKENRGVTGYSVSGSGIFQGNQTVAYNGSYVTFTAPSENDQETYAGLAKNYDGSEVFGTGLNTVCVQRIDVEGIDDTDDAEVAKLTAMIAASMTPITNCKLISASFQRADDDSTGGQIILRWGLQNSIDAIETPRTNRLTDPNNLRDQRYQAIVYATLDGPPETPTEDTLKIYTFTDQKLNDQLSFRMFIWRRVNTADEVINPETRTNKDPEDLVTTQTEAVIWDQTGSPPSDPTPPTGLKIASVDDLKLNDTNTRRVYELAKNDSKDKVEQRNSLEFIDPTGITSRIMAAKVDGTPSIGGFVDRGVESRTLTADGHVVNIARGGTRSTAEDITMPRTKSSRSWTGADLDTVTSIIESTNTDEGEADNQKTNLDGTANLLELSVSSVNETQKTLALQYANPGVIVDFIEAGGKRLVYARVNPDNSGNIQVFVKSSYGASSGFRRFRFSQQYLQTSSREMVYRRFFQNTSLPTYGDQEGTCNNDYVEDMPAGTVVYRGMTGVVRRDVTTRAFFVDYRIHYDAAGIISEIPIDYFQSEVWLDCSITEFSDTAPGWYNVNLINADFAALFVQPAQTSLAFLYS